MLPEGIITHRKIIQLQFTDIAGDDYSIAQMDDSYAAVGHCEDVSRTILNSDLLENAELVSVEALTGSEVWWHVAVGITDPISEELTVYDYTARQFSTDLPFPLVQHYDTWVNTIETHAKKGTLAFSELAW